MRSESAADGPAQRRPLEPRGQLPAGALSLAHLFLELPGIFVFGISGGLLAVRKRMDVFGVLVLALIAALGGGIVRDLLLGVVPPASLRDNSNLVAALAAAATCFFFHARLERIGSAVAVFDAVGLGLFSVTGTLEALRHGLDPIAATLLGVVTGVGGGALRDVLANEVPFVLEREIYALAALVGAILAVASKAAGFSDPWTAAIAAACATTLRLLALRFGWEAPRPPGL